MGWGQRYRPGLRSDPGEGEIHQEPGQSPRVSGHHQRCWQSVLAATTKDHRAGGLNNRHVSSLGSGATSLTSVSLELKQVSLGPPCLVRPEGWVSPCLFHQPRFRDQSCIAPTPTPRPGQQCRKGASLHPPTLSVRS